MTASRPGPTAHRSASWVRVGQRVRERRSALRLSPSALAERAGLPTSTVEAFERGEGGLTPDVTASIYALARALDVRVLELLEGPEPSFGHITIGADVGDSGPVVDFAQAFLRRAAALERLSDGEQRPRRGAHGPTRRGPRSA